NGERMEASASIDRRVKTDTRGFFGEEQGAAFGDQREEERAAGAEGTDVCWHGEKRARGARFRQEGWASTPTLRAPQKQPPHPKPNQRRAEDHREQGPRPSRGSRSSMTRAAGQHVGGPVRQVPDARSQKRPAES